MGHRDVPRLLQIAGHGGTVSRRTANKKLTKLYWTPRKRSPERLIVLIEPKSGGARQKNLSGAWRRIGPPHFKIGPPTLKFVPAPLADGDVILTLLAAAMLEVYCTVCCSSVTLSTYVCMLAHCRHACILAQEFSEFLILTLFQVYLQHGGMVSAQFNACQWRRWLGRQSLAGGLSPICTWSVVDMWSLRG